MKQVHREITRSRPVPGSHDIVNIAPQIVIRQQVPIFVRGFDEDVQQTIIVKIAFFDAFFDRFSSLSNEFCSN